MKVAGSGNIEQLELPPIPDIESFKSYEPESKIDISQNGGEVTGEKIFEKVLIPRYAGDYQIPEITFAFFNPGTGKYQTEKRGPFKILLFGCYFVLIEFKRLGPDPLNLHEVLRAFEESVRLPVLNDPFGIFRSYVL